MLCWASLPFPTGPQALQSFVVSFGPKCPQGLLHFSVPSCDPVLRQSPCAWSLGLSPDYADPPRTKAEVSTPLFSSHSRVPCPLSSVAIAAFDASRQRIFEFCLICSIFLSGSFGHWDTLCKIYCVLLGSSRDSVIFKIKQMIKWQINLLKQFILESLLVQKFWTNSESILSIYHLCFKNIITILLYLLYHLFNLCWNIIKYFANLTIFSSEIM